MTMRFGFDAKAACDAGHVVDIRGVRARRVNYRWSADNVPFLKLDARDGTAFAKYVCYANVKIKVLPSCSAARCKFLAASCGSDT